MSLHWTLHEELTVKAYLLNVFKSFLCTSNNHYTFLISELSAEELAKIEEIQNKIGHQHNYRGGRGNRRGRGRYNNRQHPNQGVSLLVYLFLIF